MRRRRRSGIRRVLKWIGLAACVIIWLTFVVGILPWPKSRCLVPLLVALAIPTAALFWSDKQYSIPVILAGAVGHSSWVFSTGWMIALGWRRPVQDWMIAHGMAAYAGHFGLFYLFIPDIILNLIGGAFVGFLCYRRWLRYALLFGVTHFAINYAGAIMARPLFSILDVYNLMIVPFAICGGWLAPGRRRRYKVWLAAEGFCQFCGYNLTANTSGICPECGTPIPRDKKQAEPTTEPPKE